MNYIFALDRIRRCLRGSDTVQTSHSLDAESKVLCERFLRHHKHSCQSALASLRMYVLTATNLYMIVFDVLYTLVL